MESADMLLMGMKKHQNQEYFLQKVLKLYRRYLKLLVLTSGKIYLDSISESRITVGVLQSMRSET